MFSYYGNVIKDIVSSYNDYELFSIRSLIKSNIKSLKKEYKLFKKSIKIKFCSFKELKTFCDKRNLYFNKLNQLKNDFRFISQIIYCFSNSFLSIFIIFDYKSSWNFLNMDYICGFFERYNLKHFIKNIF